MDMNVATHPTLPAITDVDVAEAVRSTAILADVTLALWGAERTDRKIMDDAKAAAGAVGNVGRAIKNLMAGADTDLRVVRSTFAQVRAQHYAMTLPWVSDPHAERQRGPRLLPNMLFDKYMTAMAGRRKVAIEALDAFVASYPENAVLAQANLAGLANPLDYPSPEAVRAHFRIAFDFEPVASGAGFHGLPPAVMEKLEKGLQRKQEIMVAGANKAMWTEVGDRVRRLAERMADPEAQFKAPTVSGVQELTDMLPGWNVAHDPRVDEIMADIEGMLAGVTPVQLRENLPLRATVAAQAQAVTDKLAAWGL